MIAKAVHDIIVADSGVTGQLATYEKATGVESPAVFTYDSFEGMIPKDCELPAVIINEIGGINFGTRAAKGVNTAARVRVYGNKDRGSILPLMDALFFLLDRATLVVADLVVYGVFATPPTSLSDPDGFPGYFIDVSAFVSQPEP